MHMPTRPNLLRSRARLRGGAGLIRARIWLAMLGLAVVPMLGTILLTTTFAQRPTAAASDRQAWETASAAGDLGARLERVESRLLGMAADTTLRSLLDGVDGTEERELAAQALTTLEDGADGLVVAACLVRSAADAGVSLLDLAAADGTTAGSVATPTPACPAAAPATGSPGQAWSVARRSRDPTGRAS